MSKKVLFFFKNSVLNEIKTLHVFGFDGITSNIIIVSNEENLFAFGDNKRGVLDFGNESEIKEYRINCGSSQIFTHLNPPVIHRDLKPDNILLADETKKFLATVLTITVQIQFVILVMHKKTYRHVINI
jgi:serine/threonine protein kinase